MFKFIHKKLHGHYHRKYHPNYRHAKKLFVFDLALLGLAIFMFGVSIFLLLWEPGTTKLVDLNIKMSSERIKSGESICFNVGYQNKNKINLINPVLGVNLPEGFVPNNEYPLDNHSTLRIENIPPGGSGEISVCGKIWAEPNIDYRIDAFLTYSPKNSNFQEQKNSSALLNLADSVLNLEIQTPKKSLAKQNVPIRVAVINNGKEEIKNIRLNTKPVLDFTNIDNFNLSVGEEKIFETTWQTPEQSKTINAEINININNREIKQKTTEQYIEIIQPKLAINGKFLNTFYADTKSTIPYQINWSNDGELNLDNLKILLDFSPKIIDLNRTAQENGLEVQEGKLLINKNNRTALDLSQPNTTDTFTINLKTLSNFYLYKLQDSVFKITPTILGSVLAGEKQEFSQTGNASELPIATEVNVNAQIKYYTETGDQLGRGPLPPNVGETTKYWVFAQINNTVNEIKDVQFTAKLANGVNFYNRQSVTIGPNLKQEGQNIVWNYPKLPPHSQTGLYFEIEITPNIEQLGQNLQLIKSINIQATDAKTGKNFNINLGKLDNTLESNDRGQNLGSKVIVN